MAKLNCPLTNLSHKTLNPLSPHPPKFLIQSPTTPTARINFSSSSWSRPPRLYNASGSRPSVVTWAVDGNYSAKRSSSSEPRETIMLPGCDYNHWLIVMEFPKDPAPTRDQMIDTYLNTLAAVLGGSMEEAKKNMYAFSTTTYTGFQCTVDEATSEKFKGLPGVLWVLPDSYIDVKNKDYGGDKYVNGEIIPCKYPTYQPKTRNNNSRYESRRYERRKDGPPREYRRPKQEENAAAAATSTTSKRSGDDDDATASDA